MCLICVKLNIYHLRQPGEDDVSYERHLKQLQGEFSKKKRNPQIVKELMEKTFVQRRTEILEKSYTLVQLFERFPFLQELEHVSAQYICMHDN